MRWTRTTGASPRCVLAEHRQPLDQPRAGFEQGLEAAGFLELLEPAEGGQHPLSRAALLPPVLDQLDVGVALGALDAEEHGASLVDTRILADCSFEIKGKSLERFGTMCVTEISIWTQKLPDFTGNCPCEVGANC